MQEAYVDLNGIPTRIVTWGRWIEQSLADIEEVVICITGNPGLPGFYKEFGRALQGHLLADLPIWILGHAGHDELPQASVRKAPALRGNEGLYNLDGQIKHKIDFVRKYVPANVKIHLIGHSIGAWIILQMLRDEVVHSKIQKCYLLFPTVERMKDSPNGFIYTKIGKPVFTYLGWLLVLFNMLPLYLRTLIVHLYFIAFSIPTVFLKTALKYVRPEVAEKVVFLADDEMERVGDLPQSILQDNLSLLKFYYGATDGWVPVQYYKQLIERFPQADTTLDSKNIEHAFVLRKSDIMGQIVANMIDTR